MKRAILKTLFCALLAAFSATAVQAADYHVTTAAELTAALNSAAASVEDDAIYLAAGTYNGNFKYNAVNSGGVSINAELGLNAEQVIVDAGGDAYALWLNGSNYYPSSSFKNITFQNGAGSEGLVSLVSGVTTLDGCIFKNSSNNGLSINSNGVVKIINSSSSNINLIGINVKSPNIIIKKNYSKSQFSRHVFTSYRRFN